MTEREEIENLRAMRNAVAYGGEKNSIIEWINRPEWTEVNPFQANVRGACVVRYLPGKSFPRISKFLTKGAVSGEIKWR